MQNQPTPGTEAEAGNRGQSVRVLTPQGASEKPGSAIRAHDFRQGGFLTASELRRIRQRHEQFIRSLQARLEMLFRLELGVALETLNISPSQTLSERLPSPAHVVVFKIEPLKSSGVMVFSARMALGLVDRLLGGPGSLPEQGRELSEIEVALIEQVATVVLNEWCHHWPEAKGLQPALRGHENGGQFLENMRLESSSLMVTLNLSLGEQREPLHLAFPLGMVEPLLHQLEPGAPAAETMPASERRTQWNSELNNVSIQTTAEWHGLSISALQMTRLKPGDVLMLAPGADSQVQINLSNKPKFLGRAGVCGRKWAVQLTNPINA